MALWGMGAWALVSASVSVSVSMTCGRGHSVDVHGQRAVVSGHCALDNGQCAVCSGQWVVGSRLSALDPGFARCGVWGVRGHPTTGAKGYGPFSEGGIAPVVGCAGCGRDGGCFCSKTKHLTLD